MPEVGKTKEDINFFLYVTTSQTDRAKWLTLGKGSCNWWSFTAGGIDRPDGGQQHRDHAGPALLSTGRGPLARRRASCPAGGQKPQNRTS